MSVSFPFKEESSSVFDKVHRPIAQVFFKHTKRDIWQPVTMLIDTGADYTMLPRFLAEPLGVDLKGDCKVIETEGVGGKSKVFLKKTKIQAKIGQYARKIPVGFLAHDYIPPLLGRQKFFETFKVTFEKFQTTFE
ncbi:retroviral-like aspartic protease family protein [Candidatus Curtissbacteria bacterium]|nr:retroviral-like aspartic protease family protein [Candidatus Curtissbacteria bacterium]